MKKTKNKEFSFIRLNEASLSHDPSFYSEFLQDVPQMIPILERIEHAFQQGIEPARLQAQEAYLLKDEKQVPLAVFKPFKQSGCQDVIRECLAYRLDHQNFANVPGTIMTQLQHPLLGGRRIGSCQQVIYPSQPFYGFQNSIVLKPEQIRRLAILDLRLLNADRHGYNVMIKDAEVFPIDHACILPERDVNLSFFWQTHPHASTKISAEEFQYLQNIDLSQDIEIMTEEFGLERSIVKKYVCAHLFLQEGLAQEYNLVEIAECLKRREQESVSRFSVLLSKIKVDCCWQELIGHARQQFKSFYLGGCPCV
ncbi:MAG: hypothetical protein JSS62_06410 [Verrucomicrobia bacterium]|nr:hypothetical protein [Verrucomicrobiota bacterium]MBS0646320.1 hypothetical protein [Verrucomicrobiota bacterium]